MENIKSTLRSVFSVNKKLLPLKVTLFMFAGAAYAMLPYLTIHMKDIGISDIDVALIYSILPFCVFTAPPLVGFFADKIGNYTRVNMVFIVLTGVFHTALLLVPPTITQVSHPEASINIRWVKIICFGCNELLLFFFLADQHSLFPGENVTFLSQLCQKHKDVRSRIFQRVGHFSSLMTVLFIVHPNMIR